MLRSVLHVKKKDVVQVMVGKEKGKTGKVLRVHHKTARVFVEKLNILKRHTKATQKGPGGIVESEGPIQACNVLLYCDKCGRGVRSMRKVLENGNKVRFCKKCKTQLDK